MSGPSPSGFASLRARFEQNKESDSPPSRGRSPAGSFTSDQSRPISKVRTSFISVEGGARMGDSMNTQDTEGKEAALNEDVGGSRQPSKSVTTNKPQINGETLLGSGQQEKLGNDQRGSAETGATATDSDQVGLDGTSDANPDKPVSAAEDEKAGVLPADLKDESAVSGSGALAEDPAGLGSILKGSPFERHEESKAGDSKAAKSRVTAVNSQPSKSQPKSSAPGSPNGKSKKGPASKAAPQPKSKSTGLSNSVQSKPYPAEAPYKATVSHEVKSAAPTHPIAVETKSAGPSAAPINKSAGESHREKNDQAEPHTPIRNNAPTKQPTPGKASPKPAAPKELKKDSIKDVKKLTGKPSAPTKSSATSAPKPNPVSSASTAKPIKKQNPTSPKPNVTKPRPKSPTRPARLPAAATAPTTASAAKVDGANPSASDQKPIGNLSAQDQARAKTAKPPPKPARTSLPARSKPEEKPKASKSRQSIANSKAPEGSFLDRMMRPTQSSSQKTHEKVEVKSPPRKQHLIKPKRISEGSDKGKTDHIDSREELSTGPITDRTQEPSKDSAKEPVDEQAALTDVPSNRANEETGSNEIGTTASVSAAAHTVPPTIPVP